MLMTPWCHANECSIALMSAVGAMVPYPWVLIEHLCVLMRTYENSWVLMSAHGRSWAFVSMAQWCSWGLKSTHGHGTMTPTALMSTIGHSFAWHHVIDNIYGALAPNSSRLMRAHECPWVSRSVHGCSLVPINVSERSGVFKFLIQLLTKNVNL